MKNPQKKTNFKIKPPIPDIYDTGLKKVRIFLNPSKSEHPNYNVSDLFNINGPSTISIKGAEDPVKFFFWSCHVLHIGCLVPFKET